MPSPIDPRRFLPSRAEPDERQKRKQLEKEHAIGFKEVTVLSLIGIGLAWDIDKQVRKKEEKREKEEAERKRREEREERECRRRGRGSHGGASDSRRDYMSSFDGSRRREQGDRSSSRGYAHDPRRRQSVDHRADMRYNDRYGDRTPRYDSRAYHRPHDESRSRDQAGSGRSRRDSW
ncbi:hypothetical protein F4859DRAFT_303132 [Xylaria cf. heliscus]|nr:hypothetical protein F4859DRAFT_303132 [Xylaria cf. heliscus]